VAGAASAGASWCRCGLAICERSTKTVPLTERTAAMRAESIDAEFAALPEPDQAWIKLVLDWMAEDRVNYFTAHWVFARKVLRETRIEAVKLAARYQHKALTLADCLWLRSEWIKEGWLSPSSEGGADA
jgi:hypothetical protein